MEKPDVPSIADAVRRGLCADRKSLPAHLLYDARGSALFEQITELPEYYLTRAERSIFAEQAEAIAEQVLAAANGRLSVMELGAGTATKSQLLVRAIAKRQGRTTFVPADLSPPALSEAASRIAREEPLVDVRPLVATHESALAWAREFQEPLLVLFVGSSIGNYEEPEAVHLLASIRAVLRDTGALLLGADLKKSADVLIPAYDDAQGVTAAFNLNTLARINRELGGEFDLARFRHVALWNEAQSRVEMHLESLVDQHVRIALLDLTVHLRAGERIHTESSHKYDLAAIDELFRCANLVRRRTFTDRLERFGVFLAEPD